MTTVCWIFKNSSQILLKLCRKIPTFFWPNRRFNSIPLPISTIHRTQALFGPYVYQFNLYIVQYVRSLQLSSILASVKSLIKAYNRRSQSICSSPSIRLINNPISYLNCHIFFENFLTPRDFCTFFPKVAPLKKVNDLTWKVIYKIIPLKKIIYII